MIAWSALTLLARLRRDGRGTMAIETAIVAPMLIVLSIGGFEVSSMVTRQSELQSAAAEAVAIVMAATPDNATEFEQIETVVEGSSGLPEANVSFETEYRCGTGARSGTLDPGCDVNTATTFLVITMTDSYAPIWTQFGIGNGLEYNVTRTVQIG